MKIAVSGYYGMGNFGDDLFLHTLRQIFDNHTLYPWTSHIDPQHSDAVIIGGGDLITPYSFNSYYFHPLFKQLPTWLYGVGIVDVYPEHTWPADQVAEYRAIISKAKRAVFRDDRSAAIAKRVQFHHHVETDPDIVFGYREPRIPIKRYSKKPTIGLCVFSYDSFPLDNMTKLLSHLMQRGYHVVLIPVIHHPGNRYADYETCLSLQKMVQTNSPASSIETMPFLLDLELTYSYIQAVDFLISFKLHPSLVALRAGVPVLAFSHMNKVESLLSCFDLERYYCDYNLPLEALIDQTELFLQESPALVDKAKPKIRRMEERSLTSLYELKKNIEMTIS
ncbi:polysaccharide pyruvyl transferase family protein [Paenibacillus sp. EC2-1]|uniref:polysaccharide pyruvyl transferase family protein n=1 Tax=Paenibacillus sp. EC2-1 TaxID=3388665 RepID=UPI003BEF376D